MLNKWGENRDFLYFSFYKRVYCLYQNTKVRKTTIYCHKCRIMLNKWDFFADFDVFHFCKRELENYLSRNFFDNSQIICREKISEIPQSTWCYRLNH